MSRYEAVDQGGQAGLVDIRADRLQPDHELRSGPAGKRRVRILRPASSA